MQAITFVLLALASVAIAGDVDFKTCSSANQATILRFGVSGCPDGATSCTFIKGQTYDFDFEGFLHDNAPVANSLMYIVTGSVLEIPLILLEGDACDDMECPIQPGASIRWQLSTEISATTPAISGILVTVRIWPNTPGTNVQAAACAQITVSIKNP